MAFPIRLCPAFPHFVAQLDPHEYSVWGFLFFSNLKKSFYLVFHELLGLFTFFVRLLLEKFAYVRQGHILAVKVIWLNVWPNFPIQISTNSNPNHAQVDIAGVELNVDLLIDGRLRFGREILTNCGIAWIGHFFYWGIKFAGRMILIGKWKNRLCKCSGMGPTLSAEYWTHGPPKINDDIGKLSILSIIHHGRKHLYLWFDKDKRIEEIWNQFIDTKCPSMVSCLLTPPHLITGVKNKWMEKIKSKWK
jgi:hypothetical protein